MRPTYLVVAAAVLGVAALLFFLVDSDSGHTGSRSHSAPGASGEGSRGDGSREGGAARSDTPAARARERSEGEIALTILVTSGGDPVADAAVLLTGPRVWRGTTDANGRAIAPWLVEGKYAVVASKGQRAAAQSLEMRSEDREVELSLAAAIPVRGKILAADGSPIADARIHAEPNSEETSAASEWRLSWLSMSAHPAVFAEARSAGDGKYELLLPAAGGYTLRVNARGFGGASEPVLEYAAAVDGLDFYLQPGSEVDGQVREEGGAPVAGALVALTSFVANGQHSAIEVTDSDGKFTMAAAPGSWSNLSVYARGYATATFGVVRPPAHGLRVTIERGATIRVRFVTQEAAEPIEGVQAMLQGGGSGAVGTSAADGVVEFHNITLAAGGFGGAGRSVSAVARGFVPHQKILGHAHAVDGVVDVEDIELERGATIRGRVTDASTGDPIEGVELRPFSMRTMRFQNLPVAASVSDAQGRYESTGAPPDTVAVLATHDDFASEQSRRDVFTLARDPKNHLLAPGQLLLEYDIALSPALAVAGSVLGPDGKPLQGARVAGPWQPGAGSAATTTTGGDGRFKLAGFAKGQAIQINATHRSHGGTATAIVTVGSAVEPVIELGGALNVQGRVVDSEGTPVSSVSVTLSAVPSKGQPAGGSAPLNGVTDAAGIFVIRSAEAGERVLQFDHGLFGMQSKTVTVPASGESLDVGTIRLEQGVGLGGRVVDASGSGVSGVFVRAAYSQEAGSGSDSTGAPDRTSAFVTTDREGRFEMWGLKDGTFRLTAVAGGLYATSPLVRTGEFDVRVDVKEPARIRGRVVCDGQPVRAAWVQATQPGSNPGQPRWLGSASSGEDGVFDLGPLPPEETFDVKVTHQEYRTLELKGVTAGAAPTEYVLDAGEAITGVVVDTAGKPIANASVSVEATGASVPASTTAARTKQDGTFRVAGLEAGRYRIAVIWTAERHAPSEPMDARPGGEPIRIVIAAGKHIKGRIKTDDPQKLGQLRVLAIDKDGNTKSTAWIWNPAALDFDLPALAAGSYTVKVMRGWPPNEDTLGELTGIEAGDETVEINIRGN